MSKETSITLLGVTVIVLTQLGIPGSWRTTLLILAGLAVVGMGLSLRAQKLSHRPRRSGHHTFVENGTPHAPEHERKEGVGSLN